MAIKTHDQIILSLTQYVESRLAQADVSTGTALNITFIQNLSSELADLYAELSGVQQAQSLLYADQITSQAMDALAYNWNITRKPPRAAQGFVTFSRATVPTTDIRIGLENGTGGTQLSTRRRSDNTSVSFITTSTKFLLTTTTQDPTTGLYSIVVPVSCTQTGSIGNVEAGTITVLQGAVPGIDQVTNTLASTGGRPEESNAELAARIQAKVLGLHPGVANGLRTSALNLAGVENAFAVGPNDPTFERAGTGGAVDLVILGENLVPYQETFLYTGVSNYGLTNKPATEVLSIVALVGLTNVTLTPNIDYEFLLDTTSSEARSTQSTDQVLFLPGGRSPTVLSNFAVSYRRDQLVADTQEAITASDAQFITASPLAKRAQQVLVDITMAIIKNEGAESAAVESAVATAITNFVTALSIGDTLTQSDLVAAVHDVDGVDNITLPIGKLAREGETGTTDLTPSSYEYFRVNPSGLTVTVS